MYERFRLLSFLRDGGLNFQGDNFLSCGQVGHGESTTRPDKCLSIIVGKDFSCAVW